MKRNFYLNIVILIFFVVSLAFSEINFPYLQYVAGILIFFLPGLNSGWILELISKQKLGISKMAVWTIATSPIIVSLFSFISIILNKLQFSDNFLTFSSILPAVISFIILLAVQQITKRTTTELNFQKIKNENLFWIVSLIVFVFLGINFLLYKFIPEADGYTYLIQIRDFSSQGKIPAGLARPLFISFSLTMIALTRIPTYWIFKILLPLLVSSIFLPFYLIAKEKFSSKTSIILLSILPFTIPVVCMEILTPRPQSIFILSFILFIYLAIEILKIENTSKKIYFLTFLFFLSLAGIKMHEFFYFLVMITGFSLLLGLLPIIKKKRIEAAVFFTISFLGLFGWIKDLSIINQFDSYLKTFSSYLFHPKFNLWFIGNYTNVDGNQMGWTGLSWIFYYGYNLGLVMPTMLLYAFFKKLKNQKIEKSTMLILGIAFLLFFSIAEIFPRLGLAYLPDRAWLFVSLSMILTIAFCIPDNIKLSKVQEYLILVLFLIAGSTSFALTYAKQGWTTPNEFEAAKFIENDIPADSIIISQSGNAPMIKYFGNRILVVPPQDFFYNKNQRETKAYIENLPSTISRRNEIEAQRNETLRLIQNIVDSLKNTTDNVSTENVMSRLKTEVSTYDKLLKIENEIKKNKLDEPRPVYILYSNDKFTGLYGNRQWWKTGNFFEAKLEILNQTFPLIYDKNNILIWKAT